MRSDDTYLAFGAPDFTTAEIDAVARVMRSGWVGMGAETLAFEAELGDYIGARHVIAVNSCTSALFLALLAEGIGPGDEVIVPSLTWCATANAALYLGATPVFCDVDERTFCVTPETIADKISSRTKAAIVVHYGGYAADIDGIRQVLPPSVSLVEDAAHAFGATYQNGVRVGASGNCVCFSFYANKNLSTAEGGAISLGDDAKAARLRRLRMSGMAAAIPNGGSQGSAPFRDGLDELGYKMNFTDLQAAIGRAQLARFDIMAAKRRAIARRFKERFEAMGDPIQFQSGVFSGTHARHLLVGLFNPAITGLSRDDLLLELRQRNIGASLHYRPLHLMPLYAPYRCALPVTEALVEQIMTLPISSKMDTDDVDHAMKHMAEIFA